MTVEKYFNHLKSKFENASQKNEVISKAIRINEFILKMNFLNPELIPVFYDAFDHLSADPKSEHLPSLTLNFWDQETTGSSIGETPWRQDETDHLGLVSTFTNERFYTLHQPGSGAVYMFDCIANECYYWVSSSLVIPWWESDFPLRMILHWWLKNTPYQPIHAAAVGTENGGILLAGKGGSGKSTTALLCLNSNLKLAGDDYVLLDCQNPTAYSLFSLTKVNLNSLRLLTHVININKLKAPIDDKYRIKLAPDHLDSLIKKIPIVAILLPEVTQNETTTVEACGAGEVMRALAPTTLFQLPGLRTESFKKMAGLVRSVPGYRLLLGKDSGRIPEFLEQLITSIADTSNR